jgi:hypothetical protein
MNLASASETTTYGELKQEAFVEKCIGHLNILLVSSS